MRIDRIILAALAAIGVVCPPARSAGTTATPSHTTTPTQTGTPCAGCSATPTHTPTPSATRLIACTPPPCTTGEVFYCPASCPGGCGTICATPTPSATPNFCLVPITIAPTSGPPGTRVDAAGNCYFLHSGREGLIYFDAAPVADVRGDTEGEYETPFTVPAAASRGAHAVTLRFPDGSEIGATSFEVTAACVGDCNGDAAVTVDELVTGLNVVLGRAAADACPAFACNGSAQVTVNCLVTGVDNLLRGCR